MKKSIALIIAILSLVAGANAQSVDVYPVETHGRASQPNFGRASLQYSGRASLQNQGLK